MIVLHLKIDRRVCLRIWEPTSCAKHNHPASQPASHSRIHERTRTQKTGFHHLVRSCATRAPILRRTDKTIKNTERRLTQEWVRHLCIPIGPDTAHSAHGSNATKKWKMRKIDGFVHNAHTHTAHAQWHGWPYMMGERAGESSVGQTEQSIDLVSRVMCLCVMCLCLTSRILLADTRCVCVSSPEWAHKGNEIVGNS